MTHTSVAPAEGEIDPTVRRCFRPSAETILHCMIAAVADTYTAVWFLFPRWGPDRSVFGLSGRDDLPCRVLHQSRLSMHDTNLL